MNFLYPAFLFALAALAIPVIIHLFSFRRYKKVMFTNVRFLTNIQQESRSQNKIRQWILLALRLLALACLVLAFAQPFFPHKKSISGPGRNYVSIYIDNSFSMGNTGSQGDLLQIARKKAEEIARAYRESDAFQLLTNDFEVRQQRWVNRPEFIRLLTEIAVSPHSRTLSEVYARQRENFRKAENENKFSYWLTDYQQNMADLSAIPKDTGLVLNAVPLQGSKEANVYIDSVWFDGAIYQLNQNNTLHVKLVNSGPAAVDEGTLTLTINGKQKALANYALPENGTGNVEMPFTITEEGFNKAELSLTDYPIVFDDSYYFTFKVSKDVPVLVVNGNKPNPALARVFGAEQAFRYQETPSGSLDYSSFSQYKFLVLNELPNLSSGLAAGIKAFMEEGGNVLIVPAASNPDLSSYTQCLQGLEASGYGGPVTSPMKVSEMDIKNPIFRNIFESEPKNISLPEAKKYYQVMGGGTNRTSILLRFSNGDPFLTMTPYGKGYVFTSAVPLDGEWSNFSNHALFLPLMYKMALFRNSAEKLSLTLGKDNAIQVDAKAAGNKERIYLKKDKFEVIPGQRSVGSNLNLFVEGLVKEAGFYDLSAEPGKVKTEPLQVVAFNYDRKESTMKFLDANALKEKGTALNLRLFDQNKASLTTEIKSIKQGAGLWKWLVLGALFFLLCEALVIRFMK